MDDLLKSINETSESNIFDDLLKTSNEADAIIEAEKNKQMQKEQSLRNEYQRESDRHNTTKKALESAQKSGNKEDSEEMKSVKSHLNEVTKRLQSPVATDFKSYKQQVMDLSEEYNQLIASCETYLATRKLAKYALWGKAKNRRRRVQSVLDLAKAERKQIRDIGKDRELYEMRMEGKLVGNSLAHAVFQQAEKTETADFSEEWAEMEDHRQILAETEDNNKCIRYTCADQPGVMTAHIKSTAAAGKMMRYMGLSEYTTDPKLVILKDAEYGQPYYSIKETLDTRMMSMTQIKEQLKKQGLADGTYTYTPDALRQLANIKMISILFGLDLDAQEDILFRFDYMKIDGKPSLLIRSACIGNLSGGFTTKLSGKQLWDNQDFLSMTGCDRSLCEYIRTMDKEDIRFVLGDILSKEEINAFNDRLEVIRDNMEDVNGNFDESAGAVDEIAWETEKESKKIAIGKDIMKDLKGIGFSNLFDQNCAVYGSKEDPFAAEEHRLVEKAKAKIKNDREEGEKKLFEAQMRAKNGHADDLAFKLSQYDRLKEKYEKELEKLQNREEKK